jgi:membrane-associated PAP2 superfamily phosphatase
MPSAVGPWRHWVWALVGVMAWDATAGDLAVAHLFGDSQGFAARNAFWAEQVLHDGLRWVSVLALAWMLFDLWRPALAQEGPSRAERAWALGGTLLALLLVPALKTQSSTSCPWSLSEFGGVAHWVSHWDWGRGDGGAGRCFPSGHAVGSFAFFSLVWLWRDVPRVRTWMLLAVLLAGSAGSLAQWARGAHFVSHSLWSAWLCAAVTAAWQALNARSAAAFRCRSATKGHRRGPHPRRGCAHRVRPEGVRAPSRCCR